MMFAQIVLLMPGDFLPLFKCCKVFPRIILMKVSNASTWHPLALVFASQKVQTLPLQSVYAYIGPTHRHTIALVSLVYFFLGFLIDGCASSP